MKKNMLLLSGLLFGHLAAAGTLYNDRLDNAASTAVGQMQNRNGEFITGSGWKATAANSQLRITLPAPLPASGSLLVDVRNFDPVRQNIDVKQQIINLYSQENGSKAIFETNGSWINIRTGTGYSTGEGVAGFKMLAAPRGIDTRDEVRIMEDATWDLDKTYEFKITWDNSTASVYLNGRHCYTLPFEGQVEMFRYIFLGTDNVYVAQPGVIYSNLRILGSSDTAVVPTSAREVEQPLQAHLLPNYPNPFNPETTLAFEVQERAHITLVICNLFGQIVRTLVDAERAPGFYEEVWDGRDQHGRPVAGGAYFSRLTTVNGQSTRRMTLLK
ncbi:MAG TPA: FlgD immunoglobulin-like domain containing protein [bacterium]|nr:FlgD immunoglobulin-like domain containing protein [bacterium]HQG46583.1 FlgD immunoglobulin-like domain containing protein [bacterium]HQI50320.1 FlgD immunoglobulin-like domain containing protein [bacterium]HQJ64577.1 FlgD immunoglobulin-like domain containing protein [bacterium]